MTPESNRIAAALLVDQIKDVRKQCSKCIKVLSRSKPLSQADLEACAHLGDALATAHELLRLALAQIAISRLKRNGKITR